MSISGLRAWGHQNANIFKQNWKKSSNLNLILLLFLLLLFKHSFWLKERKIAKCLFSLITKYCEAKIKYQKFWTRIAGAAVHRQWCSKRTPTRLTGTPRSDGWRWRHPVMEEKRQPQISLSNRRTRCCCYCCCRNSIALWHKSTYNI